MIWHLKWTHVTLARPGSCRWDEYSAIPDSRSDFEGLDAGASEIHETHGNLHLTHQQTWELNKHHHHRNASFCLVRLLAQTSRTICLQQRRPASFSTEPLSPRAWNFESLKHYRLPLHKIFTARKTRCKMTYTPATVTLQMSVNP